MVTLANEFAKRGYRAELVVATSSGALRHRVSEQVRVVDLRASRALAALWPLSRHIRRARPAVLLSTLNYANVVALAAAALSTRAVRVVVREAETRTAAAQFEKTKELRVVLLPWVMRLAYRKAWAVIAVSEGVAADLHDTARLTRRDIKVVPNPVVGPELFRSAQEPAPHPWFYDGGPPVVVAAGRLHPVKDFASLIRAVAEVSERKPVRLIVLGEGDERQNLEALRDALDLRDHVDLPGHIADPIPFIANADVFVLSSISEGLPNALIQAVACGRSIVATDCRSGPREILDDGQLGRLVPIRNPAALAEAIGLAIVAEPDRRAMALQAERYSVAASTTAYLAAMGLSPEYSAADH